MVSTKNIMKVTAFIGSARKKHTHEAVETLLKKLQSLGDVDYEIVMLGECRIETCRGCKLCLDRGEELCPLKDDRDMLIEKMTRSDGVIFASPNYSFNVSGTMKIFLDRLGFVFHRPRFFGRAFTSIVAQGVYGGKDIVRYFNFIGNGLGFNVTAGTCLQTREPITEKSRAANEAKIDRQARIFHAGIVGKKYPPPSLFKLMVFRMSRTSIRIMLDETFRDYAYFRECGWFESDYYYPVTLNPFKKLIGKIYDLLAKQTARNG